MLLFFIVILAVVFLTVIFAVQNVNVVFVNFLMWRVEGSLALILLLTFVSGFIVGLLILLPKLLKRKSAILNHREKANEAQQEKE